MQNKIIYRVVESMIPEYISMYLGDDYKYISTELLDQFEQHDGFDSENVKVELDDFFNRLLVLKKEDLDALGISTPLSLYSFEEINDSINGFRKGHVLIVLDDRDDVIFLLDE